MALTITPATAAATGFKKNSLVSIIFEVTAGAPVLPISWTITAGSLPTWLAMLQGVPDQMGMVLLDVSPRTLATGAAVTITATDSTPVTHLTGTATITTTAIIDGPDPEGFHVTLESWRTQLETADQYTISGPPGLGAMTPADVIARMWPLSPPAQNS